jgi:hypothetical protein
MISLDTVRGWFKKDAQTDAAKYDAIVADAANGKEARPEWVGIIRAVGKDEEQFAANVQVKADRRRSAEQMKAGTVVPAELAKIEAAEKKADARRSETIDQAERQYAETVAPLQRRYTELQSIQRAAQLAEQRLQDTFHNPETDAKIATVRKQIAELHVRLPDPRKLADDAAMLEASTRVRYEQGAIFPAKAERDMETVRELKATATEAQKQLATMQAQIAELRQQEEALIASRLEP